MPTPNFYNENANRAYPFLKNTVGVRVPASGPITMSQLPNGWIVDAGFTTGLSSYLRLDNDSGEWTTTDRQVYLKRIYRQGVLLFFEFEFYGANDWPSGYPITFVRSIDDPLYVVEDVDSDAIPTHGSYSYGYSEHTRACELPMWTGYLVTGDLSNVPAYLADGDEIQYQAGAAIIEPSAVVDLTNTYLNDLNVANLDRVRATSPSGCSSLVWPERPTIFVHWRCIQGDIRWTPGYNCRMTQNDVDNSITISAVVGDGQGEPCEEIALGDADTPPINSTNSLLSGGPECNETLRSINGLGGPLLQFIAGTGVSIIPDPVNHKISIDVNMFGLAVCFDSMSQISEQL